MNNVIRTLSVSALALTVGVLASGCGSSSTPHSASPVVSATSTPTSSPAPSAPATEVPVVADAPAGSPAQTEVKAALEGFFTEVKAEAASSLKSRTVESTSPSAAQSDAEFKKDHAASYARLDAASIGEEKAIQLVSDVTLVNVMKTNAILTVNENAVVANSDTATVKTDALTMQQYGATVADKSSYPGSITLKNVGGKWLISGYDSAAK